MGILKNLFGKCDCSDVKAKLREVEAKLRDTEEELLFVKKERTSLRLRLSESLAQYEDLRLRWNRLVERINDKGGEAFLSGRLQAKDQAQFTPEELRKLLMLCHPDKHDGKPMAVEMTTKLNLLRGLTNVR